MSAILEVEKLGKRYIIEHRTGLPGTQGQNRIEEFWALKDITFQTNAGDRIGLIGRNGAGKSTLLKLLSRITSPTTGTMTIRGRVASLLEVGSGFHPDLTGRENIFLNGTILGMTQAEIRGKFDAIVDFAEVGQFLDTPVKRFSSGMYARLAFAVAVHLDSEILIIDEVLSVGDGMFQKKCLEKINEIANEGRTIFFVSHSVASITAFCNKGFVLSKGQLVFSGDAQAAVKHHMDMGHQATRQGDLSHYRIDGYEPYITGASTIDDSGLPLSIFPLGADITFKMFFDTAGKPALHDPVMGVTIYHSSQGVVGTINSRMTGYHAQNGPYESGIMTCKLTNTPLIHGRYSADIVLGDGLGDLDVLSNFVAFEIAEIDIYKTGKAPLSDTGVMFFNAQWSIQPNR